MKRDKTGTLEPLANMAVGGTLFVWVQLPLITSGMKGGEK